MVRSAPTELLKWSFFLALTAASCSKQSPKIPEPGLLPPTTLSKPLPTAEPKNEEVSRPATSVSISILEIMSPKYQKIIAFSKPIFQPPYSDDNNAWMRLSVKDATNNQEKVVQDLSNPSSSVFIPYPGSTDGWSPDGRYMVVIRVANFNQEDKKQQTYQFLDVVEGIWVEFKNGKARATVDNFLGWDKAQEHTAILRYRGKRLKVLPSPLTSQKDLERPREKSPSKRRRFM